MRTLRTRLAAAMLALTLAGAVPAPAQQWLGEATLGVSVKTSKGAPLSSAEVTIAYRDIGFGDGPRPRRTDNNGEVNYGGIAAGTWSLKIDHPDHLSYLATLIVRQGRKPEIVAEFLEATGTGRLTMRVKFLKGVSENRGVMITESPKKQPPPPSAATPSPAEVAPVSTVKAATGVETAEPPPPAYSDLPATAERSLDEVPTTGKSVTREPTVTPAAPFEEDAPPSPTADIPDSPTMPVPTDTGADEDERGGAEAPDSRVDASPSSEPVSDEELLEPAAPPDDESAPVSPAVTDVIDDSMSAPAEPAPLPTPASEYAVESEVTPEQVSGAQAAVAPVPSSPDDRPSSVESLDTVVSTEPPRPTVQPTAKVAPPSPEAPEDTPQAPPADTTPVAPRHTVETHSDESAQDSLPGVPEAPAIAMPAPGPTPGPVAVPDVEIVPAPTPDLPPAEADFGTDIHASPSPPSPPIEPERASLRSSRDRSCPECRPGEWSVSSRVTVATSGEGTCSAVSASDLAHQMKTVVAAHAARLAAYVGPFPVRGTELPPELDQGISGSCRLIAVVLPRGARYSGFRFQAEDDSGGGDCIGDRECPVGEARWLWDTQTATGQGVTIVYSVFRNDSVTSGRTATLTAFFVPSPKWTAEHGPR